jgi:hypothetical protein
VLLCWLALLLIRVAERHTGHTWRHLGRIHQVTLAGPAGRVRQTSRVTPAQAALFTAAEVPLPPEVTDLEPAEQALTSTTPTRPWTRAAAAVTRAVTSPSAHRRLRRYR